MDASAITALAALVGATIGGLTSVLASWLTQRTQVRAQWLAQDIVRRQDLYNEFIEEASKCYVHALQHDEADIPALVRLYAKLGRMRLLSSPKVLESAAQVERKIVDTYLAPDKTFLELREMINSGRSICFATSVGPAGLNSNRFAVSNFETKARRQQGASGCRLVWALALGRDDALSPPTTIVVGFRAAGVIAVHEKS